jgi:hypothetical protein
MRDIWPDEHQVALFNEVDLIPDEAGAFCSIDEHQLVFLVKMPGFVKVITFPININKGRVRR